MKDIPPRKYYEKPELRRVKLETTEAVMAFCKSATIYTTRHKKFSCAKTSACKHKKFLGS